MPPNDHTRQATLPAKCRAMGPNHRLTPCVLHRYSIFNNAAWNLEVAAKEDSVDRRSFVIGSAAAAAVCKPSFAQDAYPTRAITVINPFPPGGAADVGMRPLAAALEPLAQKPLVIDTQASPARPSAAQAAPTAR